MIFSVYLANAASVLIHNDTRVRSDNKSSGLVIDWAGFVVRQLQAYCWFSYQGVKDCHWSGQTLGRTYLGIYLFLETFLGVY